MKCQALVLAAVLLAGCGGPRLYPVQGTVVWADGKPALELAGGAVNFEASDGGPSATGPIDKEARYLLGTHKTADGVAPGEYRVTITPPQADNPDRPPAPVLHPDYQRLETTKLKVSVEQKSNDIPLSLERFKR